MSDWQARAEAAERKVAALLPELWALWNKWGRIETMAPVQQNASQRHVAQLERSRCAGDLRAVIDRAASALDTAAEDTPHD